MSGFPTRLGRALRLFTPVVLASALALPLIAPAKDHKPPKKDAAAVQPPANTIASKELLRSCL